MNNKKGNIGSSIAAAAVGTAALAREEKHDDHKRDDVHPLRTGTQSTYSYTYISYSIHNKGHTVSVQYSQYSIRTESHVDAVELTVEGIRISRRSRGCHPSRGAPPLPVRARADRGSAPRRACNMKCIQLTAVPLCLLSYYIVYMSVVCTKLNPIISYTNLNSH